MAGLKIVTGYGLKNITLLLVTFTILGAYADDDLGQVVNKCAQATPATIQLKGAVDPKYIQLASGDPVVLGPSGPTTYRSTDEKKLMIHSGCPLELVTAETGDMRTREFLPGQTVATADKVLLCGRENGISLIVNAAEVKMVNYEFNSESVGQISIKTGKLTLEGVNKLSTESLSRKIVAYDTIEFVVHVETAIEGSGALNLESKASPCP